MTGPLRPLHLLVVLLCLTVLIGQSSQMALAQSPATPSTDASDVAPAVTTEQEAALDSLLEVLRDERQRQALLEALEQVRQQEGGEASTVPDGEAPIEAPSDGHETVVVGGMIGALASSLDALQTQVDEGVIGSWQDHWRRSANDIERFNQRVGQSVAAMSMRFALTLGCWALLMVALIWSGRRLAERMQRSVRLARHPRAVDIAVHCLRVPLPALIALSATAAATLWLGPDAPGRALALGVASAVNTGTIFATLWLILIILVRGPHRCVAIDILHRRAFLPLAVIAGLGTFAGALLNSPLTALLGYSLAYVVATLLSFVATLGLAAFVIVFRRPIGQLLYNRSLANRRRSAPYLRESLRLFSRIWFLPILLMCMISLYQLTVGSSNNHQSVNRVVLSTLLLVGALLLGALLHHLLKPDGEAVTAEIRLRLQRLVGGILQLLLVLVSIELLARIWDGSLYRLVRETDAGQVFGNSLASIAVILLVTMTTWIVVDAAISRALAPPGRRRQSQPSLRVRTILPLLRNATKIVLVVIAVVTVMGNIGINIAPLIAGAGVVGLAIGFGSQTLVQDVITGIFNILEDTMAIGDGVEIDGRAGTVEGMTIRTLRLRDSAGALFSIPFSQVRAVRNTSRQFAFAPVDLRFTLDSDIDRILSLVRQAADETQHDPSLRNVLLGRYENWGLERVNAEGYNVAGRFRTTTGGAASVRRAFHLNLARLVEGEERVSFARSYAGGR